MSVSVDTSQQSGYRNTVKTSKQELVKPTPKNGMHAVFAKCSQNLQVAGFQITLALK